MRETGTELATSDGDRVWDYIWQRCQSEAERAGGWGDTVQLVCSSSPPAEDQRVTRAVWQSKPCQTKAGSSAGSLVSEKVAQKEKRTWLCELALVAEQKSSVTAEFKISCRVSEGRPKGKICNPSTQICGNKFHNQLYKVYPFPPFYWHSRANKMQSLPTKANR